MEIGATGHAITVVTESATAAALGSGDMEVFGTPALVALLEAATVSAVADALSPGSTTVGSSVRIEHTRPSRIGAEIAASAELQRVEGRTLTFSVVASSEGNEVGSGTIERVVVDRDRFMESAP